MIEKIRRWLERRARFRRALRFNRVFTFRGQGRGVWMCPSCGSSHFSLLTVPLSGPIYSACCGFEQGHRLDKQHATGL